MYNPVPLYTCTKYKHTFCFAAARAPRHSCKAWNPPGVLVRVSSDQREARDLPRRSRLSMDRPFNGNPGYGSPSGAKNPPFFLPSPFPLSSYILPLSRWRGNRLSTRNHLLPTYKCVHTIKKKTLITQKVLCVITNSQYMPLTKMLTLIPKLLMIILLSEC